MIIITFIFITIIDFYWGYHTDDHDDHDNYDHDDHQGDLQRDLQPGGRRSDQQIIAQVKIMSC